MTDVTRETGEAEKDGARRGYKVRSQSGPGSEQVGLEPALEKRRCTCMSFVSQGRPRKHIAAELEPGLVVQQEAEREVAARPFLAPRLPGLSAFLGVTSDKARHELAEQKEPHLERRSRRRRPFWGISGAADCCAAILASKPRPASPLRWKGFLLGELRAEVAKFTAAVGLPRQEKKEVPAELLGFGPSSAELAHLAALDVMAEQWKRGMNLDAFGCKVCLTVDRRQAGNGAREQLRVFADGPTSGARHPRCAGVSFGSSLCRGWPGNQVGAQRCFACKGPAGSTGSRRRDLGGWSSGEFRSPPERFRICCCLCERPDVLAPTPYGVVIPPAKVYVKGRRRPDVPTLGTAAATRC